MHYFNNTIELSSHEGTRCQFNGSKAVIKLGIDVHQDFYVVVKQEGGTNPKPAQRLKSKPSCIGRPSSSKRAGHRCMLSMKRVDLVLRCSAS